MCVCAHAYVCVEVCVYSIMDIPHFPSQTHRLANPNHNVNSVPTGHHCTSMGLFLPCGSSRVALLQCKITGPALNVQGWGWGRSDGLRNSFFTSSTHLHIDTKCTLRDRGYDCDLLVMTSGYYYYYITGAGTMPDSPEREVR